MAYIPEISIGPDLPFKDVLENQENEASSKFVRSAKVPSGEIWEVTSIGASTGAAAGKFQLYVEVTTNDWRLVKTLASSTTIEWQGRVYLSEGMNIYALHDNSGAIGLAILGIKRYTWLAFNKWIEDQLTAVKVEISPDLQETPLPDPKM